MDIKESLRKALLEGKHKVSHKNEYGCVMVYLKVNKADWSALLDKIDDKDLYDPKDDPSYGKEHEPHATILFGLHTDIPDADIEKEIDKIKAPKMEFKSITSFTNPKFGVLKFDIDSDDLHKLNKKFTKFPHTTDYPNYHPHVTTAYVKPKMVDKYIKKLNNYIENHGIIKITVDKIIYSKANGVKKEYKLT